VTATPTRADTAPGERDGRRSRARPRRVPRPPGPPGWRFGLAVARRESLDFVLETVRAYPRLSHLRLGSEHYYVIAHPALARAVLVTH
jgi:hypothetical protein